MNTIKSMTGYGKGEAESDGRKITIELKTVNHRFLDLLVKLPRGFQYLEDTIRKTMVSNGVVRGHVDVYFNYEDNRKERNDVIINEALAIRYKQLAEQLNKIGYVGEISVSDALKVQDMVVLEGELSDEELLKTLTQKATEIAVKNLIVMRETEGTRLVEDIKLKVVDITETVYKIRERAPMLAKEYREKLSARIKEALMDVALDETKLANEVTFFVDKSNIDEEITRLLSHMKAYGDIFTAGGEVGKKLDYLTQEANREVNTIASKSNDMQTTNYALYLKNQVEKIREQIQNLE